MVALLGTAITLTAGCRDTDSLVDSSESGAAEFAFANSVNAPPPGAGRTFELSDDYPTTMPGDCDDCGWLSVDVDFANQPVGSLPRNWEDDGWADYLTAILNYVREGQDPNLDNDVGFQIDVGGSTRWYSVPWMAFDEKSGREYFHGLTNERTLFLKDIVGDDTTSAGSDGDLATKHTIGGGLGSCADKYPQGFESWSVGYYNEYGGYALGQAIPASGEPQLAEEGNTLEGLPFPEGTAVIKVLTTSAPVECVPFLAGSPEWQVNRHKFDEESGNFLCERAPQISRVVQVDVAVRDARSPSGWVYGTFAYNSNMGGDTFWENLMPLGLQWGGDPTVFPAVSEKTDPPALQQTVLYPDVDIFQHGGCEGRLAGPADNAQSSCVSCHASAFSMAPGVVPVMGQNVPPSFGFNGLCTADPDAAEQNKAYFSTIKAPAPYSDPKYASAISLDTSLQLAVAMKQYAQFATTGGPKQCVDKKAAE